MTEGDILTLIENDPWMMNILRLAESMHLPDWMIGAGFVRSKVWNTLHGFSEKSVDVTDIDLIYFDLKGNNELQDKDLSEKLTKQTGVVWEVVNQTYTHKWHNREPYASSEEALADWVETATCVAVKLENQELKLVAPWGIEDLVSLVLRPTESHKDDPAFYSRIEKKEWLKKWPRLKVADKES